jgi:gluconokinase
MLAVIDAINNAWKPWISGFRDKICFMHKIQPPPKVIVLTGVSGSGKTTVGQKLAEELGWDFYDGDDSHPRTNIEKMSHGIPLTDADRWPWLDRLNQRILKCLEEGRPAVLACSALKQSYRERLLKNTSHTVLVYLCGDFQLISQRMQQRHGHYMQAGMLQSQFDAWEEPTSGISVDIDASPDIIVAEIIRKLGLKEQNR